MSEIVSRTTTPYSAMQYTGDNYAEVKAWFDAFGTRYGLEAPGTGYAATAATGTIAAGYWASIAQHASKLVVYVEPTDWLVVTPGSVTASTDAQMRAFTSVSVG